MLGCCWTSRVGVLKAAEVVGGPVPDPVMELSNPGETGFTEGPDLCWIGAGGNGKLVELVDAAEEGGPGVICWDGPRLTAAIFEVEPFI